MVGAQSVDMRYSSSGEICLRWFEFSRAQLRVPPHMPKKAPMEFCTDRNFDYAVQMKLLKWTIDKILDFHDTLSWGQYE